MFKPFPCPFDGSRQVIQRQGCGLPGVSLAFYLQLAAIADVDRLGGACWGRQHDEQSDACQDSQADTVEHGLLL